MQKVYVHRFKSDMDFTERGFQLVYNAYECDAIHNQTCHISNVLSICYMTENTIFLFHRLWGQLFKQNWNLDFTFTPKSLPARPRLHLSCLAANRNFFEIHHTHHGYQLPCIGIRLSSDKRWEFK